MKSFSAFEIAKITDGRIANESAVGDLLKTVRVASPAVISKSKPDQVCFFFSREYQNEIPLAKAGILVTGEPFVKPLEASGLPLWKNTIIVACKDPYLAMAKVLREFAPELSTVGHFEKKIESVIHPTAVVHSTVVLGHGVQIMARVVIEAGAKIGDYTVIYPGTFIGPQVDVGSDCVIFPNVTLYENTQIGSRVRIHAGTVIGADGFGYVPVKIEEKVVSHYKIYHLGRVCIGDDVEIGGQTSIDRGTIGDTVIGSMSKIDNNVHLGHNVQVGQGSIICGNVGMAGSSSLGQFATVGGMSAVDNKVHIGDRAMIAGFSGIVKDVPPGEIFIGFPAREYSSHFQIQAILNRMLMDWKKKKQARREQSNQGENS